jgi:hypothetical protein
VSSRHLLGIALAIASFPVMGCGRRATPEDCQLIVDRSVELQAKEADENDPATLQEREKRIRAALGPEITECESRRVTDRTMACVQAAKSSKELETCLR